MKRILLFALSISLGFSAFGQRVAVSDPSHYQLFAQTNLVAWCIVPFDSQKRDSEARAAMLEKLGFRSFAYDYRAEHIPTFETEIEALHRHHVNLTAWWFPTEMNAEARQILDILKKHNLKIQLWVMGGGAPTTSETEQKGRVESESKRIRTIAEAAAKIGCTVGLYNHDNWFGEPENQIQIIERLQQDGISNVGIIYNLHHGHTQTGRFAALLDKMTPYLWVVNINGMPKGPEQPGKKIMPVGSGEIDLSLLQTLQKSKWRGPIGILNHTDEDAELRLQDNVAGLNWLVPQLEGKTPGPKPHYKSWTGSSK